jgi:hypothetical protein
MKSISMKDPLDYNGPGTRISISLASVVLDQAAHMMRLKGYNNNASSYFADLVRRDFEHGGHTGGAVMADHYPKHAPKKNNRKKNKEH